MREHRCTCHASFVLSPSNTTNCDQVSDKPTDDLSHLQVPRGTNAKEEIERSAGGPVVLWVWQNACTARPEGFLMEGGIIMIVGGTLFVCLSTSSIEISHSDVNR